jgi:hypothetical protein
MPDEPIPLNWEEQEARAAAGGKAQIPLDWEELGAIADRLQWERGFSSSNVAAFAFQAPAVAGGIFRLFVAFKNGTRYCYDYCPYEKFVGMKAASSKGVYLNEQVKKAGYTYHGPF